MIYILLIDSKLMAFFWQQIAFSNIIASLMNTSKLQQNSMEQISILHDRLCLKVDYTWKEYCWNKTLKIYPFRVKYPFWVIHV